MASISSSTSFSASRGLSGLVSGLDTESMVEKLLSGTQAKIDKQNATKQQLSWKQDAYRNVIGLLTGMQDKYFNYLNPTTNLLSNSFFNAMSATTKSDAVRVSASNTAFSGKISIQKVDQLAKAARYESGGNVSSALKGEIDAGKLSAGDAAVDITLDGIKKTIRFSGSDADAIRASLKQGIENAFGSTNIVVGGTGSEITLSSQAHNTSSQITVSAAADGNNGLDILGFKPWQSNKVNTSATLQNLNLSEPLIGDSFSFTINGKTITATSGDTMRAVIERINNSGAGVKVSYSSVSDKFSIEATETGAGRAIDMKDTTGNLLSTMFGIGGGGGVQSSPLITGQVTAAGFTESSDFTADSSFSITVGGVKKSFNFGSSSDIPFDMGIKEMNRMLATAYGTTSEGSETKNKVEIELLKDDDGNVTGAKLINRSNQVISFDGEADNLLTKLGFTAGQSTLLKSDSKLEEFGFAVGDEVNGTTIKSIIADYLTEKGMPEKTFSEMTAEDLAAALQTKLNQKANESDPNPNAAVTIGEDGRFTITADTQLSLTGSGVSKLFGVNEVTLNKAVQSSRFVSEGNVLKNESKLTDFGFTAGERIGGIEIIDGMIAETFVHDLQGKLREKDSSATVTLNGDGSFEIFAPKTDLISSGLSRLLGAKEVQPGQNAQITLADGTVVERATNSFEIDGVFIELLAETKDTDPVIEIGVTRNTDQILSGIKSFISEYNSLIDTLNSLVSEDPTYKKYAPLTAEQKKEMSENEVKLWEEQAKGGLLRGDSIINGVLSSMRSALYSKPAGAQFALYDLGITTGEWTQNGKLNITDEAKLKQMIEDNTGEIEKLFTDSTQGLAVQMNKILDGAAKKSTASPGSLVNMAGVKGFTSDNNNTLSRQMKSIDDTVENLKRTYEAEKTRYWKQFNAMEKIINNMNQQSTWLASQFG